MNKLKILFIVLIIIGSVFGINFYRSENRAVKLVPNNHQHTSEETSPGSKEITSEVAVAQKIEESEFQDLLDQKFKTLPTIDDLQQLTDEDVHYTPELLKDAGGVIGQVQDEAQMEPAKRIPAMHFFKKCAEDQALVPAIRAVCLNKVYSLIPTWEIPVPISDALISPEVSDLASKLR